MSLFALFLIGGAFGLCVSIAQVYSYDCQIAAILFRDKRFMKFFSSAAISCAILMYLFRVFYGDSLPHLEISLYSILLGGTICGFGWAMCGYCPGTMFCAFAHGRVDGLASILGGICGGIVYSGVHHKIAGSLNSVLLGAYGLEDLFPIPSISFDGLELDFILSETLGLILLIGLICILGRYYKKIVDLM